MAHLKLDRVAGTTTSAGVGALTLSAAAVEGYSRFQDVMANGDTTYVMIEDRITKLREGALVTYNSGTLTRTTTLSSSTGSLIDFPAGTKDIFIYAPASKSLVEDVNGDVTVPGTLLAGNFYIVPAGETATVTVPGDEPTIQAALAAIAKWQPQEGSVMEIVVAKSAAPYAYTTPIIVDHPYGRQLRIRASANGDSYTYSSLVSIGDAGAGNHSVVITLASVVGLAVGRYLRLTNPVGTGNYRNLAGFWKITDITGNDVTLLNTDRRPTFGATTMSACSLLLPPVQIDFASFSVSGEFYGLEVRQPFGTQTLVGWDQIALVGDGSTAASNGVGVFDGVSMSVGDGRTFAGMCLANWKRNGLWVFRQAQITATGLVVSGCGGSGVNCILGGQSDITTAVSTGNVTQGYVSGDGSLVNVAGSLAAGNTNNFYCNTGSHMVAVNAKSGAAVSTAFMSLSGCTIDASGSDSIGSANAYFCSPGGKIYAEGATSDLSSPNDFYPPKNVLGPQGRLIWTASAAPAYLQAVLTVVANHTFGSIGGHAQATQDVTLTGVDTTWGVIVSCINGATAGFDVRVDVTTTNTVRITATNLTAGSLSLPATNYRIHAFKMA